MARTAGSTGDGNKPILPFSKPVRRVKINAEIKEDNKTRGDTYLAWVNSLDGGASHSFADLIDLALEEVFRRDKGFQKHEASKQNGAASTRADSARTSPTEASRTPAPRAPTTSEK